MKITLGQWKCSTAYEYSWSNNNIDYLAIKDQYPGSIWQWKDSSNNLSITVAVITDYIIVIQWISVIPTKHHKLFGSTVYTYNKQCVSLCHFFNSHSPKYGLAYTCSLPLSNLISGQCVCDHYITVL